MPAPYRGAGNGQCLAITNEPSQHRCRNGVPSSVSMCGTHMRCENVTFAPELPEHEGEEWYYCDECGWQIAYQRRDDGPKRCDRCGDPFDADATEWHEHDATPDRVAADGGVVDS